ncbi:MAG: GTPase domain-containing protein, partial [Marinobacter sp.]|nr:GTPase domain-containing protein [Marinobacter sp.]
STRKAVLSRADGVVFVADSQVSQQDNNAMSFGNLEENLDKVGLDIETLPMVIQFNKRDMSDIVPEQDLQDRWAGTPWAPLQMASALRGDGVLDTFRILLDRLYLSIAEEFRLAEDHGIQRQDFVARLSASSGVGDA